VRLERGWSAQQSGNMAVAAAVQGTRGRGRAMPWGSLGEGPWGLHGRKVGRLTSHGCWTVTSG
jgi:hypothetical protein